MKKRVMKVRRLAKQLARSADGAERIVTSLGAIDFKNKIISNSGRGTFQTCRRKYLWSYGYNLQRRGVLHYFVAGQMFHSELEKMYLDGKFDRAAAKRRIDLSLKEALLKCVTEDQRMKAIEASAVIHGMVPAYANHYFQGDLARFSVIEAEGEFEPIPIPNTDWKYRGVRDMMVKVKKSDKQYEKGEVGLVEHKTTGQLDVNYLARLPLDFQILSYCWSWQMKTGELPDFILYNVAQKSRLRQKKDENKGQFCDRIEADYLADPTKYFYRERVEFSKDAVQDFVDELTMFCNEDLETAMASDYYSMNTQSCTSRGQCEFLRLCIEGPTKDVLSAYQRKERRDAVAVEDEE